MFFLRNFLSLTPTKSRNHCAASEITVGNRPPRSLKRNAPTWRSIKISYIALVYFINYQPEMKQIISLLFILSAYFSVAQTEEPVAVVSCTKMNVLYIGIDNPISVAVPGVDSKNLVVAATEATLISSGNGNYIVKPNSTASAVTISVAGNVNGKIKSYGSYNFRVKRVPDPYVTVGGYKGGEADKAVIQTRPFLKVVLENFDFEGVNFEVTSFTMSCVVSGTDYSVSAKGNQLSAEMLTKLNEFQPGQKIYFEDIKCKGPDGAIRHLGSMAITLK
jgi:gliding motility-associated protein GldM